jgi:hypothetical protein
MINWKISQVSWQKMKIKNVKTAQLLLYKVKRKKNTKRVLNVAKHDRSTLVAGE